MQREVAVEIVGMMRVASTQFPVFWKEVEKVEARLRKEILASDTETARREGLILAREILEHEILSLPGRAMQTVKEMNKE